MLLFLFFASDKSSHNCLYFHEYRANRNCYCLSFVSENTQIHIIYIWFAEIGDLNNVYFVYLYANVIYLKFNV